MNKLFKIVTKPEQNFLRSSSDSYVVPYTKIIINNLKLDMLIGVHDHEKKSAQPVIISIEATVPNVLNWQSDTLEDVVDYETIVSGVQKIARDGHIELLETFAAQIADFCLQDPRVYDIKIRLEKPEIFNCMDSIAIEIYRVQDDLY